MDTNTAPNPTPFSPQDSLLPVEPIEAIVPVQARPQRTTGAFKRHKLLAVSAAIAALVASGGLAATSPHTAPAAGPASSSMHSAPGVSPARGS
jgi:hypothetical protein